GAGQADRPEEQHALAVDGGEEGAGGEGRLGRQLRPEGRRDQIGFAVLLQLDDGGLEAVGVVGGDADEPRLVRLAAGDGGGRLLDGSRGGEVIRQPQGGRVEGVGGRAGGGAGRRLVVRQRDGAGGLLQLLAVVGSGLPVVGRGGFRYGRIAVHL